MKTADFLREHRACCKGAKWALSVSSNMADVWDELVSQGKHEWLIWTATRPGVFPDSVLRTLACRFVRETPLLDGRTVWDLLTDDRSKKAVEVSERYVDGNATEADLYASRAAEAAYRAASTYAADAACFAAADAADAAVKATELKSAADLAAIAVFDAAAAVTAAYDAAVAAAGAAAYDAGKAASCSAGSAAKAASCVSAEDDAAKELAYSAQTRMIAALGNPFRRSPIQTAADRAEDRYASKA